MTRFSSWNDFFRSVFGDAYMVWHDGVDYVALREEAKRDRVGTIQLLLDGLARGGEVAPGALAELSAVEAVPALTNALVAPGQSETFGIRVAEALFHLTGDGSWVKPVLERLKAEYWGARNNAVVALGQFPPTSEIVSALLRVVGTDSDALVRHSAADTLLEFARMRHLRKGDALLNAIASEIPSQWMIAADEIARLIAADAGCKE